MSAVSVSESGVRPILADAVDLARRALLELEPAGVGAHLGVAAEDDSAATHHFEATLPGYRGWQWAVVVAAPPEADYATVSESALLPGPDALVAPDFVPWDQRIRPGDLAPGDLLAPPPNDPRLVPGYVANGDPAVDEVALEIGLGRTQVLSLEGREEAAERWYAEFGPDADMAKAAPSTCGLCGFYLPLAGSMRAAFGVCGNAMGADGHVVHVAYGCGAHSDTVAPTGGGSPLYEAFDDAAVDLIPAEELLAPAAAEPAAEAESADAAAAPVEEAPSAGIEPAEVTQASAVAVESVATEADAAPVEDAPVVETESADESGASLVLDSSAPVVDAAQIEAAPSVEAESADATAAVETELASNVATPVAETGPSDAAVAADVETAPAAEVESVVADVDAAPAEVASSAETVAESGDAVTAQVEETPAVETESADEPAVAETGAPVADAAVAESPLTADAETGESGSATDDVAEAKPAFDVVVEPSGSVTVVADGGAAEADVQASSGDERVVDGGADSSPQS